MLPSSIGVVGALTALEELLADQVRVLGTEHPDTLTTRANIASWRGQAGDVAGALAASEEVARERGSETNVHETP